MDPTGKFWPDTELNNYVQDWVDDIQGEFELVWGTATVVTSTDTLALSDTCPDALRLDAVYFDNRRLAGRSKEELFILRRDWATNTFGCGPIVSFQNDSQTVSFWPPPIAAGTVVFEYPQRVDLADDSTPCPLPAWARYTCKAFVCYRALTRPGPTQDLQRAARYRALSEKAHKRLRHFYANFLPTRYSELHPGGRYEGGILNPPRTTLYQ